MEDTKYINVVIKDEGIDGFYARLDTNYIYSTRSEALKNRELIASKVYKLVPLVQIGEK